MSEKIKEGTVAHLQGMTMELSEAANSLPAGHVLHWHTELVKEEAPAEVAAEKPDADADAEKPDGEENDKPNDGE